MTLEDISTDPRERLAHVAIRLPSFAGRRVKMFGNESNTAYLPNFSRVTQLIDRSEGATGYIDFTDYKQEVEVTQHGDWLGSFYEKVWHFYYGTTTTVIGSVVFSESDVHMFQASDVDAIEWPLVQMASGVIYSSRQTTLPYWFYSYQFYRHPVEVTDFCKRHGIFHHLWRSQSLMAECFSSIQNVSLRLEEDPEIEDKWVVIDLFLKSDIDTVLSEYDTYVEKWVTQVPWPDRDKIRLSYHIL